MAVNNVRQSVAYGFTDALLGVGPEPILSKRAPGTADKAQLGTLWIDVAANTPYVLTSVVGSTATWVSLGGGGGAGVFTSVTATTGNITATLGNIVASAGSVSAATTVTAGTGITATTGNIVATAGNINATAGSISAGTTITAGTGITSTTGNIIATAGNIVSNAGSITASTGFILGAGPKIIAGAGSPSGTVTAPQGSLYLNTTGNSASTRAYINSDSGTTWIAVTTAS